ncbi:LysR family transcriptional regulator [Granulosicoccus antarcticus]|uniref:HTH-type transcriptional regulator DmlR n=1 Tax=Granulosicoccus antarcticus IMCC3135 TaxID=1192854 RepID=A0A2Z2NYS0_9GAMM|nr:LysR family transcriptional regulator [Granulosicoccus antarcticus]ASJ74000.1 HTH-type transcriptional regulator DmlR [Granulosicoccus antarcticus IMCC3135]
MDTQSIRLFVLAADKLNISAAGRELNMAPAVASSRLAKLEKSLGADLLHRSTRSVSLSMEGAEFLPYAREMLAQEEAAYNALGRGTAMPSGTLRFAASSTFAQLYIAPLLPEFLRLQPAIRLDLRLTDTQMPLIEGSFDLALRSSTPADSSLKGRKLANDTRILCASPGYLEEHGEPVHPDELNSHQLISFKDNASRLLVDANGAVADFNPKQAGSRLTIDDGLSHKLATVAGAGISINSLWSVHRELNEGSLVRVLPHYRADEQTMLWLVYPKSNVLTAKVRVFIDFLLDRIGASPVWENES